MGTVGEFELVARAVAAEAMAADLRAENDELSDQVMAFQGGEAYELGVIHGSAGVGKEIDGLRARVAELEGYTLYLRGQNVRMRELELKARRTDTAEAQVARVRERHDRPHYCLAEPPNGWASWYGTDQMCPTLCALDGPEPTSNSPVGLSVQAEATSGVASTASSSPLDAELTSSNTIGDDQ